MKTYTKLGLSLALLLFCGISSQAGIIHSGMDSKPLRNAIPLETVPLFNDASIHGSEFVAAVPEPSTYAMMGLGLLVLIVAMRKRTRAPKI